MKPFTRSTCALAVLISFVSATARADAAGGHLYCELNTKDAHVASAERLLLEIERAWLDKALAEYGGQRFNETLRGHLWDGIRRFWFSHYRRAERIQDLHRALRSDLVHSSQMDSVMRALIADVTARGKVSDATAHSLQASVDAIPGIQDEVKKVIREIFESGNVGDARFFGEKMDLYAIHKRAKQIGDRNYEASLDESLWKEYVSFRGRLDEARREVNLPERTLAEFDAKELEVAHPLYRHKSGQSLEQDIAKLSEDSQVSYRVKRSRTETYTTGSGKDRRTHTRTVYYWSTTTPDYRQIIHRDFDTGHATDSEFDEIFSATERLAKTESVFRKPVDRLEEGFRAYFQLMAQGRAEKDVEELQKIVAQVGEAQKKIKSASGAARAKLAGMRDYAAWSESNIIDQWSRDVPEHFQARNALLLARYESGIALAENLLEQIRRGHERFEPNVVHPDYSEEMNRLRQHMWQNNVVKALAAIAAGGTVYYYREDLKLQLDRLLVD